MGCWGVGERHSLEEIMLNDREKIDWGLWLQENNDAIISLDIWTDKLALGLTIFWTRKMHCTGKCKICAKQWWKWQQQFLLYSSTQNVHLESVTKDLVTFPRFPPWRLYDNDNAMQIWNKLNNGWPERLWGPVLPPVITNWLIFSGEDLGQESREEKQYQIFDSGLILEE